VYFPGSTIGNFHPEQAREFLSWLGSLCGPKGALLIGFDLKKDRVLLERAYNDAAGITAAFNLNLLARLNREAGANFDTNRFRHLAVFNQAMNRVEMHLVSLARQTVRIGGEEFRFQRDETIQTESCYKYEPDDFRRLAGAVGFELREVWTDPRSYFSMQCLTLA
jgi:dimethylhistidine N-methyltransferase